MKYVVYRYDNFNPTYNDQARFPSNTSKIGHAMYIWRSIKNSIDAYGAEFITVMLNIVGYDYWMEIYLIQLLISKLGVQFIPTFFTSNDNYTPSVIDFTNSIFKYICTFLHRNDYLHFVHSSRIIHHSYDSNLKLIHKNYIDCKITFAEILNIIISKVGYSKVISTLLFDNSLWTYKNLHSLQEYINNNLQQKLLIKNKKSNKVLLTHRVFCTIVVQQIFLYNGKNGFMAGRLVNYAWYRMLVCPVFLSKCKWNKSIIIFDKEYSKINGYESSFYCYSTNTYIEFIVNNLYRKRYSNLPKLPCKYTCKLAASHMVLHNYGLDSSSLSMCNLIKYNTTWIHTSDKWRDNHHQCLNLFELNPSCMHLPINILPSTTIWMTGIHVMLSSLYKICCNSTLDDIYIILDCCLFDGLFALSPFTPQPSSTHTKLIILNDMHRGFVGQVMKCKSIMHSIHTLVIHARYVPDVALYCQLIMYLGIRPMAKHLQDVYLWFEFTHNMTYFDNFCQIIHEIPLFLQSIQNCKYNKFIVGVRTLDNNNKFTKRIAIDLMQVSANNIHESLLTLTDGQDNSSFDTMFAPVFSLLN